MISLYAYLSEHWDSLFPLDFDRIEYLIQTLGLQNAKQPVLEVGCGNGTTAAALAGAGFTLYATDPDELTVDLARTKHGDAVAFDTQDMLQSLESREAESLLGILCLGNTLPHLSCTDDVIKFFDLAVESLVSGGSLVIQILNYPRIIMAEHIELPILRSGDLEFRRYQKWLPAEARVQFRSIVRNKEEEKTWEWSMLPIDHTELVSIAEASGMVLKADGSDWNGTPIDTDSPWFFVDFRKVQQ